MTEAWQHLPAETIRNVFGKIPDVLQIIVDDDGRNDLREGDKIKIINYYLYFY